jgi:GTP-binding protein HflX
MKRSIIIEKFKQERAFLVGVQIARETDSHFQEYMQELHQLANTAGVKVMDTIVQRLDKPKTATYVGSGKLQQIKTKARPKKVNTLIFNNNLSPSQQRNISDVSGCNVVDRTELILDIFAKHARTKQAKLQVELAQLEYSYTKLKNRWKHLSRIQGGIGFRGPGETQIEVDRREIQKKTTLLKKKLENIENITANKRKQRQKLTSISLVGYTNAGKSTLFKKLTQQKRYVADKLFATLDSKTRAISTSSEKVLLTDTIGFIRNLPHRLVSSFHATLLDVLDADLLLHVVDVSHPYLAEMIEAVEKVLQELQIGDKNILMVFNKCDLVGGNHFKFQKKELKTKYPDSVFISARSGQGLEQLQQKIDYFLEKHKLFRELDIPIQMQSLINFLHEHAEVISEKYDSEANSMKMKVKISRQLFPNIKNQIENFRLMKYINKEE